MLRIFFLISLSLLKTGVRKFRFLFPLSKLEKLFSTFSFSSRLAFFGSRQSLLGSIVAFVTTCNAHLHSAKGSNKGSKNFFFVKICFNPYGQPDRKKNVFFTTFLRDVVQKQIFYGQAERVGLILLGLVYSVNLLIFAKT